MNQADSCKTHSYLVMPRNYKICDWMSFPEAGLAHAPEISQMRVIASLWLIQTGRSGNTWLRLCLTYQINNQDWSHSIVSISFAKFISKNEKYIVWILFFCFRCYWPILWPLFWVFWLPSHNRRPFFTQVMGKVKIKKWNLCSAKCSKAVYQ